MSAADEPIQSSLWYRVAPLRPRLLTRARLHRHHYRGERWYLLQDPASGRVHRFTPAARLLLAAMDGERDVETLWQLARRRLGEDAPTQDEVIQLLGQLHASDLLSTDVSPDVAELFERGQKQQAAKRRRSWANPMAIRIPLVDPGRFLDRFVPAWKLIWGWPGAILWLAVVLPALLLLPAQWPDLTGNLSDRVLAADNLLLVAIVFPLIKALHELGHASATRAAGGEVHDMGIMMLVMMPIPYVDASSSTVLRSRWRRALIGAAGMVVELFIAAVAFYVWLAVEPGLTRAVCFNIMLVAGVSTVVFNGNPLLRYDAYYILGDLIEMPNLGQRSTKYWGYLFEHYIVRIKGAESNVRTGSERAWLFGYGILSFFYRMFVTFAIALFIGTQFFFIGVLLALWAVAMMAVMPLVRALKLLQTRQALRERRARILGAAAALGLALAVFATVVPLPQRTQAQGVVWLPEQSILHVGSAGFVRRVTAAPGQPVRAGQTLLERYDPALETELRTRQARIDELEASYRLEFVTDRSRADMVREELDAERAVLARVQVRLAELPVTAPVDGNFMVASPQDLPGRWHRQGDVIGYVFGAQQPVVRVVVEQSDVGLVAMTTQRVHVRLGDDIERVLPARISRQVPAGDDEAPSAAFLGSGGGELAMDPTDPEGRKTLERTFQFDLALEEPLGRAVGFGQRVFVRFDLAPAPLATQAWRAMRRVFLRHFDV